MANVNPIFYDEGHEPVNHDPLCKILQKILGAVIDNDPSSAAAGNATSGNQVLELAQLTAINGKLATLGQKTMAGSVPVVIASDQGPIAVTGTVTETNASIGSNGAAIPTSSTQVGGSDGTNLRPIKVSATGVVSVDGSGSTQPVSGTVAATQSGVWTVQPGNTANTTAWKVDGSAVTQPISAAALPLPTGASTSALQTTGNTSLSSIDGKLPTIGAHVTAASVAVNIASDQVVPVSATSLPLPTGAATSALQTTGNTSLSSIDTKTLAAGQATMAASSPVVIASNQSTLPVSAASLPLPTGAATEATLAKLPLTQASATAAQSGVLVQGATTTAAPTYTTGQTNPLSLTTTGGLRVDASGTTVTATNASIGATGAAIPASATTIGGTDGTNLRAVSVDATGKVNVNNISGTVSLPTGAATEATLSTLNGKVTDGHGTAAAAVRVELPTDGTGVIATVGAVTAITNALPTGANVIGQVTANAGTNLNTSLLALETGGNLATVASGILSQNAATAGQKAGLVLGAVTTAAPAYTTAQSSALSLTTAGALRTDASGSTQPVSGTVAATQSGTWTVQPGNTANTTAWKVDGSAVTQPISAAALPLPTGAATEASLVKLPVAQGSTTSGESGPLVQGAVTTAAPAYTTAQTSPLSLTTAGNLRVDGSTVTQPVSAASLPLPTGAATSALQTTGNTSLSSIDGKLVDGHGTAAAALRVELPTDGTGVIATVGAVTAITNALPTGTNAIGTIQVGNTPNTTPILANAKDPSVTTGNITAADVGTTTAANSLGQNNVTGSPTANSSVTCTITGQASIAIQLSGTASLTYTFERSIDGGTTYTPLSLEEIGVGASASSVTTSDNKAYFFRANVAGINSVRVRATAYTSGTGVVTIQPGYGSTQIPVNQGTPNSSANAWPVVAQVTKVITSQTFTRPSNTTAYAVNQVVGFTAGATNMTFSSSAKVSAGSGTIVKSRLSCNSITVTNATFRLYLFTAAPTAQADQATFNLLAANKATTVGFIDFTFPVTSGGTSDSVEIPGTPGVLDFVCAAASTTLYGILVALSAYVPTSAEVFYTELTIDQN